MTMNIPATTTTPALDAALDVLPDSADAALVASSCVTPGGPVDALMPISTSNTLCNINTVQGLNNIGATGSNDMRFPLQFNDGAFSRVFTLASTSGAASSAGAGKPCSNVGVSVLHAGSAKNGVPGFVTLHLKPNRNTDFAAGPVFPKKPSTVKSRPSPTDSPCAPPCAEPDSLMNHLGKDVMNRVTEFRQTHFYRNVVVVAMVFFVFLMVELLMLTRSDTAVSMQLSVRLNENEQMLTLASRVTARLFDAVEAARAAGSRDRRTHRLSLHDEVILVLDRMQKTMHYVEEGVAEAADEVNRTQRLWDTVDSLRAMRDHAIHALHDRLSYPGPEEDLRFLVEKHVLFERHMKEMAEAELRWLYAASDTQHRRQAVTASIGSTYVPPIRYRSCFDDASCGRSSSATSASSKAGARRGWSGRESRAGATPSHSAASRSPFSQVMHRLHVRALLLSEKETTAPARAVTQSTLTSSIRTSTVDPLSEVYLRGTLTNAEAESAMRAGQKTRLIRRTLSNKFVLLLLTCLLLHFFFKLG